MHTVLLVDDERDILAIYEKFLSVNGYEVITASGGEQALEILTSRNDINLLVLDMRMPKKNGMDVLRELSQKNIKIPTIILSGAMENHAESEELKKIGYGDTDIVLKPTDLSDFLDCVRKKTLS